MTASNHQGSVEGHTAERTGWYFDVGRDGAPVIRNVHEAGCDDIAVIATWTSATHAERLGYARLIAAAPELYEALRLCVAAADERNNHSAARLNPEQMMAVNKAAYEAAKAALSKAGGAA